MDGVWGGPKQHMPVYLLALAGFISSGSTLCSQVWNKNLFWHLSSHWAVRRWGARCGPDHGQSPCVCKYTGKFKTQRHHESPFLFMTQRAWFPPRHVTGASGGSKNALHLPPLCAFNTVWEQAANKSFVLVGEEQEAMSLLGGSRNMAILNRRWFLRSLDGGWCSPGTWLRRLAWSRGSRGARPGRGKHRNPAGSQRRCARSGLGR